jgi:hypothetical protein
MTGLDSGENENRSIIKREARMKLMAIVLATMLALASVASANESKTDQPTKNTIRVEDLPKPIHQLMQKIQQLSKKIEPEITRLGSRLGEELTLTVKQLCDELHCQEQSESK